MCVVSHFGCHQFEWELYGLYCCQESICDTNLHQIQLGLSIIYSFKFIFITVYPSTAEVHVSGSLTCWPHTHKHTHTRLTALCPGLSGWASTRKVKPIWILLEQETVSGSGISWATCKSAPRSRQITTPAPHHSVFYRPDALPAAQPTVSKHWRQRLNYRSKSENLSVSSYPYIVSYYMHLLRFFCVPAFCLPTWFLIVQCILNCNLANLCYGISIQWARCECNMAASNNANDWWLFILFFTAISACTIENLQQLFVEINWKWS